MQLKEAEQVEADFCGEFRKILKIRLQSIVQGLPEIKALHNSIFYKGKVVCEPSSSVVLESSYSRCNKPGHMKGECPENKKEKHKMIHMFKKPKAMVATWSDEDSSEKEEEEKSSSSESEEICFMANSSDGKVSTSFEDFSVEDWQDAYAELVEKYTEMRKENKHLKKKIENIYHDQSSNKRICELENEVMELNEEKENLLNLIDELKLASQKATQEFKELSEKLEKENQDKQQKIEEIKILENQLQEKDKVIETFTIGKDNLEALLGAKMSSISHGLGFNKQKPKKDKSGEKKDKEPLIEFVKGPSLENTEIKQTSSKTPKIPKTQKQSKSTRSTQSPDRSTPVHKKKDSVAVVSTPDKARSTLLHLVSTHFHSGRHSPPQVSTLTPLPDSFKPWELVKHLMLLRVDPTVGFFLESGRFFESISTSTLLHPFPVPLLSFLSLHRPLFSIPWHPSSFLAVEQS
ncbi:hypothetical protein Taro_027912 [Colocasia esculenta]|uniref:CCHC-type domain-containing protein n=1 Tax=Colocasia esculenta TaxID=4460 RepID=A0A843VF46_COLES|nr:hypothetical protein [Colocasia esculenta]